MKNKMKKIISLVLVLAISFTISIPAFAAEKDENNYLLVTLQKNGTYKFNKANFINKNRNQNYTSIYSIGGDIYTNGDNLKLLKANKNDFIPVKEYCINPYNKHQVKNFINSNKVLNETSEQITKFANECQNNRIKAYGNIKVYIPNNDIQPSTITSKGYGNKEYYSQVTKYPILSAEETINNNYGNWYTYFNNGFKVIGEQCVDGFMDTQTLGIWSVAKNILNSVIPSSVPFTTHYEHRATMQCDQYVKNTYVVEYGQYYFGAHTETASARFSNRACFPGLSKKINDLGYSKLFSKTTSNYYSPEQKAYVSYRGLGWTEYVSSFSYGGHIFSIH